MLESAQGSFVVVGMDSAAPSFHWKGRALPEVMRMLAHIDDDARHIRLRVANTTTYDDVYAEMTAAGISIKKGA